MAAEGETTSGGGAAPVAPTVAAPGAPAPGVPVAPVAPVATVVSAAEVKAPAAPVDGAKAKSEAPDLTSVLAEFEAHKKATADLQTALEKERGETRRLAFEAAFDRNGVMPQVVDERGEPKGPQYRDFLRAQLGDIDPRTEAGKAAVDALVARNPAMKAAAMSTEDPMSTFLRAKADEARKAGHTSMWGLIPAEMMRGYDVKGSE